VKRIAWTAGLKLIAVGLTGVLTLSAVGAGSRPAQAETIGRASAMPAASPVLESSAPFASQPYTQGCNIATVTGLTVGGKIGDWVTQNVQPASVVVAVWHFDNGTMKYKAAYFQDAAVPVDQPTFTSAIDAFFICVNGSATGP
jgi:hypothetical protein